MTQEKERIFLELQEEIKAGLEAYERGEAIPLEEVIAKLNSTNQVLILTNKLIYRLGG